MVFRIILMGEEVGGYLSAMYVWRSEENLQESVFLFYSMDSRAQTGVFKLCGSHYPPSCLAGPFIRYFHCSSLSCSASLRTAEAENTCTYTIYYSVALVEHTYL